MWSGWGPRGIPLRDTIYAVHHSVTAKNASVEQIHDYHVSINYGGFGYHAAAYDDGTLVITGNIENSRTCVANLNHVAICCVGIGDFSNEVPSDQMLKTFGWYWALLQEAGAGATMLGHREFLNQNTSCPGNTWPSWRDPIILAAGNADIQQQDFNLIF